MRRFRRGNSLSPLYARPSGIASAFPARLTRTLKSILMRPITTRVFTPLFSLIALLGTVLGGLTTGGCDSSESDDLLNPPRPDSALVRVVNLMREPVGLDLSTFPAVSDLAPFEISAFSPFFLQERFPIYIRSFGVTDTVNDQQMTLGIRTDVHTTYFVAGNAAGRRLLAFPSTSTGLEDLRAAGNGRLYFINALPDTTLTIKRGCRAGDSLFSSITALTATSRDLAAGEYALYLFKQNGATEEQSAHLTIAAGQQLYLIAADDGSGLKLYLLEADAPATGRLVEIPQETRTTAELEVLNGLDGKRITPYLLGDPNPIAPLVEPRTVSPVATIPACTDSNGDTLQVVADGTDTANLPIRIGVGSKSLAALYADRNGTTRMLTLDRSTSAPAAGTAYVRGVNLSRSGANVTVVVGAGAPAGVSSDLRPFGSQRTGDQSDYVPLPTGLYPLSLQQTLNGGFLDGGLQNFSTGFYTLLILEENGAPLIYIMRDDMPGTAPQRLEALGKKALFFNIASGISPRFEASTSSGTIAIESVPYSYVFPTILPNEQVTITVPEVGQTTVDMAVQGYTVGATGTPGNYRIIAFPVPASQPEPSKSGVRFLNALPDVPQLDVYISSQGEPAATSLAFGVPSEVSLYDPRRYSFTVTRPPQNDTVATIQGVQLSGGRNYMLVIGPKGATSSSSAQYGTLWMQE